MKYTMFMIALLAINTLAFAQAKERYSSIKGSGVVTNKKISTGVFDTLYIDNVTGTVQVEIAEGNGGTADIAIDDNLAAYLAVEPGENKLTLNMDRLKEDRLWVDGNRIVININCARLKYVAYNANGVVKVSGINTDRFFFSNKLNGKVVLDGQSKEALLENLGNGNFNAKGLVVASAQVIARKNGSVAVNAKKLVTDKSNSSNCKITNVAGK